MQLSVDIEDWAKIIAIQHMTRFLIVSTNIASKPNSSVYQSPKNLADNRTVNFSVMTEDHTIITQEIEAILNMVQHFFHVAVLWKTEVGTVVIC